MPLDEYGVAIGRFVSFARDNPDSYGRYFHGHVTIAIPDGRGGTADFQSAIDVNKPDGGVQYFHPADLDVTKFVPTNTMPDGYHVLARNDSSGALDYKRSSLINVPLGCVAVAWVILDWIFGGHHDAWTDNVGTEALDHLESMFATRSNIDRVFLFGAPYPFPHQGNPQGLHDVHCNQGDPPGQFRPLDGIWQDGGVIVRYTDGHLEGFFVKFETQSLNTDDQGIPI